jgi:hypothetical protein
MFVGAKFISPATLKHLILWEFRAITDPVIRLIRPITLIHRYLRR